MDIWSSVIFSILVMASAGGLLAWHVRAWRRAQGEALEPVHLDFRRRQYLRRMQTSSMLGLLGLAVLVGRLLMAIPLSPLAISIYWVIVLLVLAWIALLALVDIWATKHHFGRLRDHYLVEQARLQAELRRLKTTRGNGRPNHPDDPSAG